MLSAPAVNRVAVWRCLCPQFLSDKMEATKHIQIKDYNYTLPDDRIAKYPVAPRDHSKLLLYRDGRVSEDSFYNLPTYLKPGALMVFNNTKVIFARLHFQKTTGALIEIFCLEGDRELLLTAEHKGSAGTGFEIAFDWGDDAVSFSEVLDAIGELPIPPYLNRQTEQSDLNNYQTVYSKIEGSVAAPTAGLHFTDDVLRRLDEAGIVREEITLHVGAGTFKPVKSEEIEGHTMHAEWIAVSRQNIEHLLAHDCSCIAVGTTSVRTLESLYYIGVLIHRNPHVAPEDLHVPQWLPYEYETSTEEKLTPEAALREILAYLDRNNMSVLHTATQIIIAPGYTYKIVKTMVTNFHQPQSTLLLLVSAFVGGDWRAIYDYALAHDFRFLSYGDSSLLNY